MDRICLAVIVIYDLPVERTRSGDNMGAQRMLEDKEKMMSMLRDNPSLSGNDLIKRGISSTIVSYYYMSCLRKVR